MAITRPFEIRHQQPFAYMTDAEGNRRTDICTYAPVGRQLRRSDRMLDQAQILPFPGRTRLDLESLVDDFKRLVAKADQLAIRNAGAVPAEVAREVRARFAEICVCFNDQPDPGALGTRVQRELLPYLMLTHSGDRWYSKPRGYAGDYLTIQWIYENEPRGHGRLGRLLDQCFLDMHAAQAVRNRRGLLREEIEATLAARGGQPARVLSIACGPARELFDVLETLDEPSRLRATCVDIDLQALASVADERDRKELRRSMRLEHANVVHLVTGRQKIELPEQDLAYSIGLVDYFDDAFVVRLLDYLYDRLRPGGRVILGNFHPDNPTKAIMDHVLDWKLVHRSEADMNRLFVKSKFARPCERIRFEEQRINLFAIASRPI